MMNKIHKPQNKLAQIAARIALRSALNKKIADDSLKLGGEIESSATPSANQSQKLAINSIDANYINCQHKMIIGDEVQQ